MGGYRINGCGVTDHFKKIKSLGQHLCPYCKKITEFFLDESKKKIDVFFIPTVTLKSEYAVMCQKCGQGMFCSAEWAGYLLQQTGRPDIIFESVARKQGWVPQTGQFSAQPNKPTSDVPPPAQPTNPAADVPPLAQPSKLAADAPPPVQPNKSSADVPRLPKSEVSEPSWPTAQTAMPVFCKCPHCGITQLREGQNCTYCGKPFAKAPAADAPAPAASAQREAPAWGGLALGPARQECAGPAQTVCPECGRPMNPAKQFCLYCGRKR